ncbi:MAG: hypothetical protein Kow0059_13960 [Candidatus Sumerlaeia bacterium]
MKRMLCTAIVLSALVLSAQAAIVSDYELTTGTYASGDASLSVHISNSDLINGLSGTLLSGGFHPATVPSDDPSRIATLTDGTFASNGLTVIGADTDGSSNPSFVLEYTLPSPSGIQEIIVFSGHDNFGDRAFITVQVEVDSGSGYVPLGVDLTTGAYGQPKPNASAVAFARVRDSGGGYIATNVQKIKITAHNVSHNSTGIYKKWDDNGPPENNYPNQGTVFKEIDVIGVPATTGEGAWMNY